MSGGLEAPIVTKVLECIIYLQIIFAYACTKEVILLKPQSIIKAHIGEELHITCLGTKCQNPAFTWASLSDTPLSGKLNNVGQISVLTMKISSENLDSYDLYRCTVHCDNPPAEKGFKIIVYSFPEPILTISSSIAGEESRITCNIPDAYPFYMFNVRILMGDMLVAEYEEPEIEDDIGMKNISLSHDLILTDKYESQEIKCEAELNFQEYGIDPIIWNKSRRLNLLYPPGKPTITVSPDMNINTAENITLHCTFESISPASVQWVKLDKENELKMPSDDQGILKILNAEPKDSGVYICHVQNDVGKTSSQVQINVQALPEKPTLIIYPTSTVQVGQSVTIECLAGGNENVNITLWKVFGDGETPFLEAKGKLVIKEADPIDTAVYKCTAENHYGVGEALESLIVQYPPRNTFLTITPSLAMKEGASVHIRCTSEAIPAPRLVLKKKTETGLSELESENGQYNITHVTVEHAGTYVCGSLNVLGQQESEATVNVQVPPQKTVLTISPSTVIKEGESGHLRCTSEAFPAPKLVLKKKTEAGMTDLEIKNGEYHITHIGVEHAGTYICESRNEAGQQIAEITLTVEAPPKNTFISITPSSKVREGDDVQIQCSSEAYPSPRLALMMKTEHGLISQLESENGLYNITNAGEKNMGLYICKATNVIGKQIAVGMLTVQIPPRNTPVVTPPQNITAGVTGTITYDTHIIPPPERQQSPSFDYVSPAIIGSVVLVTAGFTGIIAYHLKQAKLKGSYSLVKALRSKV